LDEHTPWPERNRSICACHSDAVVALNTRLTRRFLLAGAAATSSALLFGRPNPVRAAPAAASPQPLLLTNAVLFDGIASTVRRGTNVLVEGNVIRALPAAGEPVANARVIDCGGRTIMPGLIDVHWHALLCGISQAAAMTADIAYVHLVAAREAERTLMRGFTSVRDVGGPAFALKRAIDESVVTGPRIFPSGAMISQTAGHGDFRLRSEIPRMPSSPPSIAEATGVSAIADGPDEVLRRAREQLLLGASQLKVVVGGGVSSLYDPLDTTQYTEPEIRAAVEAAADWGTYVCAHVYTPKGIQRALAAGVQSIEHGQLADEETVRKIVAAGAWWSLQPFLADDDANVKTDPQQKRDQADVAAGTLGAYDMAKKHGAKVAFGTDILFSPANVATQGKQLTKLARWYSNADVLRMATSENATLLALCGNRNPYPGTLGAIVPGAFADLIVIDGDPTVNLALIADPDANMKLIMKDGKIYKNLLAS
jgi:imidazolonepropionase-like amidohydrolase